MSLTSEHTRSTPFRCPGCGQPLRLLDDGARCRCAECSWNAEEGDGVLNFVSDPALRLEQEHYEGEYEGAKLAPPVELSALGQLWEDNPWAPFNATMLRALGDVAGQTVVVLGNGVATKELYFLTLGPKAFVYSDLSANAVRAVRDHYPELRARPEAFFAAIDGLDLPFRDSSVSAIYGYAFVHHLPDLDRFLAELARVLEPGGRAVFMDNAYSPLWQAAKGGPLEWLMRVAHALNPISDEDARFTRAGGFREEDIADRARAAGCEAWFEPTGTVHYLVTRASQIFGKRWHPVQLDRRFWVLDTSGNHQLVIGRRSLLEAVRRLDRWLERFEVTRNNRMRLIWGVTKPPANPV
jgi:SAM-dependent methyltransferase